MRKTFVKLSKPLFPGVALLMLGLGAARAGEPGIPVETIAPLLPANRGGISAETPAFEMPCAEDCAPRAGGKFSAGAGLYLLQPYFENNLAYALQRDSGAPGSGAPRLNQRVDISHHMEAAPLIWLGYAGEDGFGGRARWWYFRQGTNQTEADTNRRNDVGSITAFTPAPLGLRTAANPSQTLSVTSKLELQAFDLEATQDFKPGHFDVLLSGGLRLANVRQTYNAYVAQNGFLVDSVTSGHVFQGVGPVFAAEARRPLRDSGLAFVGSARASVLFGSAQQDAALASQNSTATDHRDRGMLIGELEVGLEYGREVAGSRVFGQVTMIGQEWFGAGSASRSNVNVLPGGGVGGVGYAADSDISFLGLAFRLGLDY